MNFNIHDFVIKLTEVMKASIYLYSLMTVIENTAHAIFPCTRARVFNPKLLDQDLHIEEKKE